MNVCCDHHARRLRSSGPSIGMHSKGALTLLEMMVAVTLLAVIMVGLLAMFNQTQKALHIANSQTDVFENGRGALDSVVRDLSEMRSYGDSNIASVYLTNIFNLDFNLLASTTTATMSDGFWLTKVNDDWIPFGYFVAPNDAGAGTLYRFSTNSPGRLGVRREEVPYLLNMFLNNLDPGASNVVRRVADGVVHFDVVAVYLTTRANGFTNVPVAIPPIGFGFISNDVPAFVDVEIGVLEPTTLKQFQTIAAVNAAAAKNFVLAQAGKVHYLRERVPIRSFLNPYRSNEVP